jgi:hypothetical protein
VIKLKLRVKRYYFQSGKFSGLLVYWYRYRTYIHIERGWKGHWPKDKPRFYTKRGGGYGDPITSNVWWHSGSLMLIDRRICWDTQLR